MYVAGNGNGCGCSGLGQVGLTLPASQPAGTCTGLPIVEYIKCQAEKILSPRPVPVYTPPYQEPYPGETYPGSYATPATDWTPYLILGAALLFLATRK